MLVFIVYKFKLSNVGHKMGSNEKPSNKLSSKYRSFCINEKLFARYFESSQVIIILKTMEDLRVGSLKFRIHIRQFSNLW